MEQANFYKILTIDDDSFVRQSIRCYLEDEGYVVFEAENGREGIEVFKRKRPDLVLLDMKMPQMGGLEVLETIRTLAPDMPLVVASGTGTMDTVVQALRMGAWDYVFKPIDDMAVLSHSVEKCLKESRLKKENKAYQQRLEVLLQERSLELEKSEQRYKAVFEYAGAAAIIIEPDDVISMVNSNFAEMVGMERETIEGKKKWHEFVSSRDIVVMENHLRAGKGVRPESGAVLHYEMELAAGQGTSRYVYVSLGMIPGTRRQVASMLDVTERKNAEKRWKSLEKQLRKAQKMEAIGTLAGGIAHDLNNILSPVLGYADMIMGAADPASRQFEHSEKIKKAALRAADLVGRILTVNRSDEKGKRRIRLHPVAKEVVTLLRGSIPSTITIVDRIDRNCHAVQADPTQIHQVLMNLCTNAYHAMEESGGRLTVELRQVELSQKDMAAHPNLPGGAGNYLVLEVKDTGCGMGEDVVDRIFDPYFTTKGEGKGTGLGLATVYGIVQGCRGDILVSSRPGEGSCFSVYLPALEREDEDVSGTARLPSGRLGDGERLLIVDDDPYIVAMYKEGFEELGYQVETFYSPARALAFFKDNYRHIDLVITDHTMPGQTGIELAMDMQARKKDLPVILCSGHATPISRKRLADAGIQRLMMKPLTVAALAKEVQSLLNPEADDRAGDSAGG
ncbi:MAG: response regulator [Desulfobacter sp.]|nr:MAG: response regulator [Desulfobacter sp.]